MNHERIIGIAGSIFLIILGFYNIFFKKIVKADESTIALKKFKMREIAGIFFSGYFMNTLNPGVFLFWFAASATIIEDSNTTVRPLDYRIIVFSTCLIFVVLSDIAKVLLAGKIRTKLTPHNIHIINRISGLILLGFGVVLMWGIVAGRVTD
jgi:threonine/homoserine/homoserine lactone efflux protein